MAGGDPSPQAGATGYLVVGLVPATQKILLGATPGGTSLLPNAGVNIPNLPFLSIFKSGTQCLEGAGWGQASAW